MQPRSLITWVLVGALLFSAPVTVNAAPISGVATPTLSATPLLQVQHRHVRASRGYYRGGGYHYHDDGGAAAAGAIFGFFLGSMIAASAAQRQQSVAGCAQRYRSYDPSSMTYLGYDGRRHRCP